MNGAHFCHDLQVEMHATRDTKFSRLSARWQEISKKLFETPSIDRGSTLVHRHILKVSWFPIHWLVGHVKSKNRENLVTHFGNQLCTKVTHGTDFNSMVTSIVP